MKPIKQIYYDKNNYHIEWENHNTLICLNGDFTFVGLPLPDLVEYLKNNGIDFQDYGTIIHITFVNIAELDMVLKYLDLDMR